MVLASLVAAQHVHGENRLPGRVWVGSGRVDPADPETI